jgi:hypothetical protein
MEVGFQRDLALSFLAEQHQHLWCHAACSISYFMMYTALIYTCTAFLLRGFKPQPIRRGLSGKDTVWGRDLATGYPNK